MLPKEQRNERSIVTRGGGVDKLPELGFGVDSWCSGSAGEDWRSSRPLVSGLVLYGNWTKLISPFVAVSSQASLR